MEGETPLFLSFLIDNSRCLDPPSKDFFSRYCEAVSTPLLKASFRDTAKLYRAPSQKLLFEILRSCIEPPPKSFFKRAGFASSLL